MNAFLHSRRVLDAELFLITAESRSALPQRIAQLKSGLESHPELPLRDFAYSISHDFDPTQACIAVVAGNSEDLIKKLDLAHEKLADPSCTRIHHKDGVYYYEERLAQRGDVAFMFPGEGAQYPNMLQDLAIHVEEVRRTFDAVDQACFEEKAEFVPSQYVFPAPGNQAAANGDSLFAWDAAIMSVVGANTALMKVFLSFGIKPKATIGHSFGDFTALELGGVFQGEEGDRIPLIRLALRQIREISGFEDIPEARLINIGGAERQQIEEIVARYPDNATIAMVNCPHQFILCVVGPQREQIEKEIIRALSEHNVFCLPLPFHRPYHTSYFSPAMAVQKSFYTDAGVQAPHMDVYSCCTAEPLPTDPSQIIDISTRHWSSRVRFDEAIEKMHDNGVRIFLETGPRGNLCAFVNDILKGRTHAAIPVDKEKHSTISQIHRALGQLAAHGLSFDVESLHVFRDSRKLDTDSWQVSENPNAKHFISMGLSCPRIDATEYVSARGALSAPQQIAGGRVSVREDEVSDAVTHSAMTNAQLNASPNPRDRVMLAYMDTMDQFLDAQRQVLAHLPGINPGDDASTDNQVLSTPDTFNMPMLGKIENVVPGESLDSVRSFDINEDLFVANHALGTTISVFDPELRALPIMPLLFSLELVAEAALALFPGKVLVGFMDIDANRWIFFHHGQITLRAVAQRIAAEATEIHVRVALREEIPDDPLAAHRPPMVEATAVLDDDYPSRQPAPAFALKNGEKCNWVGREIYPKRTFHGPLYQGIRTIFEHGENGMIGEIEILPRDGFFKSVKNPALTYDPVLSDCIGQSIWIWGNKEIHTGHFYLPFHVDEMRLNQAPLEPGTRLALQCEVHDHAGGVIRSSARAIDDDCNIHTEIVMLHDRDFEIPAILHRMLLEPIDNAFSEIWEPPPAVADAVSQRCVFTRIVDFPEVILETSYGVWHKAWAFVALNPPEREKWLSMEKSPRRQREWLWGRTAAKDAVRELIRSRGGPRLGEADIVIVEGENGKPAVSGGWTRELPVCPLVSIAHKNDTVIAVACEPEPGLDIGIDLELIREPSRDLIDGTLSVEEQECLAAMPGDVDEWFFRVWAAKEAMGKARGSGVLPDPRAFRVVRIDPDAGDVVLESLEPVAPDKKTATENRAVARTFRMGNYAVSICTLQQGEK
jgi:malonyl CoA-acyl carrier protein transacylase/phosphopantetheinyl transferase